jgi:hypothetical protein
MKYRKDKSVAKCDGEGQRFYREGSVQSFDSINLAKKENGLNSRLCKKFPPSVDELHAEALELDAEFSKQPVAA